MTPPESIAGMSSNFTFRKLAGIAPKGNPLDSDRLQNRALRSCAESGVAWLSTRYESRVGRADGMIRPASAPGSYVRGLAAVGYSTVIVCLTATDSDPSKLVRRDAICRRATFRELNGVPPAQPRTLFRIYA
jgi:hypothetical protein